MQVLLSTPYNADEDQKKTGKIPKISEAERYRIINDVLIARTAKRAGVMVVTDNVSGFKKIRNFCDVKVISGSKYFSSG